MIDHTFSIGASIRLEEETENTPLVLEGGRRELLVMGRAGSQPITSTNKHWYMSIRQSYTGILVVTFHYATA